MNSDVAKLYRLNRVESERGGGISKMPNTIMQGGNSGFQAVGLALLFGAARITLLGFDMQFAPDGKKHWHGDHAGKLHNPKRNNFQFWLQHFNLLAAQSPIPIINATRTTALTCFPRVDLDEALGLPC